MTEVERLREMLRLMTELQADTARRLSWWQDECVRLLGILRAREGSSE